MALLLSLSLCRSCVGTEPSGTAVLVTSGCGGNEHVWLSPQLSGGRAAAAQEAGQEVPGPHRNAMYLSGLLPASLFHCPQKNMTLLVADSLGDHFGGCGTSQLPSQVRERGVGGASGSDIPGLVEGIPRPSLPWPHPRGASASHP